MAAIRRHPAALPFLSLTEMWERFGFYVVQGILMLYLTKALGFSDNEGYSLTGAFSALAYIAPLLGGIVADRLLGFKPAVVWGGIFLVVGYALLAMSGTSLFYLGLATIIVGTGLFKSNISTLLGALYPPGDTARESGFTLFYIGINVGVLLSGSSDLIREHFGWHNVFTFASVGLLIGLGIFAIGLMQGKMAYNHAVPLLQRKFFLSKPFLVMYCLILIVFFKCFAANQFAWKMVITYIWHRFNLIYVCICLSARKIGSQQASHVEYFNYFLSCFLGDLFANVFFRHFVYRSSGG